MIQSLPIVSPWQSKQEIKGETTYLPPKHSQFTCKTKLDATGKISWDNITITPQTGIQYNTDKNSFPLVLAMYCKIGSAVKGRALITITYWCHAAFKSLEPYSLTLSIIRRSVEATPLPISPPQADISQEDRYLLAGSWWLLHYLSLSPWLFV